MKRKRSLSLALALVLALLLILTSCGGGGSGSSGAAGEAGSTSAAEASGQEGGDKEPITLSVMMMGWQLWDEPMSADPVGQWITEQTGVTLDVEVVTGELAEKYSLMLATGEYPDLMWYNSTAMQRYIAEGALVPFDDYLDQMPNVVSKFGEQNLNAMRHLDDGKLYRLNTWFMGDYWVPHVGLNIRDDVMRNEFGDRATQKSTFLVEEIEQMFRDYKAASPTTPDGNTVYPLTDWTDAEGLSQMRTFGGQMYGVTSYYEVDDTQIMPDYMHPDYLEMLKWFNKLYTEGLLDPEFAINKKENMQNKLTNGSSIATFSHNAEISQVNAALEQEDPNAYLQSYFRVASEEGKDRYMAMPTLGSDGLCVTKNCKDIPRAMEFIDFMSQPLTNFVIANGLEGGIWEYDDDGKVVILQDKVEAIPDLWDRFREYGAYKYVFMINEGVDPRFEAFDGVISEPIHGVYGQTPKELTARFEFWDKEELTNRAFYNNLIPEAGTPEAIIYQAILDTWNQMFPQIIMAANEQEVEVLYNSTVEKVQAEGFDEMMEVVNQRYFTQKGLILGE